MYRLSRIIILTLLSTFASTSLMAQESYGVVQFNPAKDNYQRADDLLHCKDMAKSGGYQTAPSLPPDSGATTGGLVAGALGGAVGGGLFSSISSLASAVSNMPPEDNRDLETKKSVYAACLKERGYTVFPAANLTRFPQDTALPPGYVRDKTNIAQQNEGWELFAKNPDQNTSILVQTIDKKLIPNLQTYVKSYALLQIAKGDRFQVGQVKPYSYGTYKGYTFEVTVKDPKIHTTYMFLDVGANVLGIGAVTLTESYEQNKTFEKDLPKYFIPALTAGK